ncbi:hypothetical protein [Luteimonas sp. FCS-9]|uniref:hypothetical protein n=1 Tax=Luteimonas sp. FCS-9 TaxID=1547516 RepID=UPI00063EA6AA|nr:hypothetical protein [Luteimonas sp. FCS-9]KLI98886.1 hypothetical protein WQ56_14235 [Luteimonas sp. FCS-9]
MRPISIGYAVLAVMVLCTPVAALMASRAPDAPAPQNEPAMQQRFIVKYRAGTAPARDPHAVQAHLDQIAGELGGKAAAPASPKLSWLRRLAVGADVFSVDPTLDAAGTRRLVEALQADPDVDYAEPDGVMTIQR